MTVRRCFKLGVLAASLLLMGSTAFKCTSGEKGLVAAVASGDIDNHAPTAESFTIRAAPNIPTTGFLRGSDPDDDPIIFRIVAEPLNGIVDLVDPESGAFTYISGEVSGMDSFSYQASDGARDSSIAIVTVEIGAGASMASLLELGARP